MGRFLFAGLGGPFTYGGLGGGAVVTRVNPGETALDPGVGALGGLAIPVTPHFRVRAEVRYLVTHDVEAKARRGITTDVSGSRGDSNPGRALFGPHQDTQFVPLLIGLDFVF